MDLTGKETFKENKRLLIVFLSIVFLLFANQLYRRNKVYNNGVYSICTIVYSEGYKGGIMSRVKYEYKGKQFTDLVHTPGGMKTFGDAYFIKLLPDNPDAFVFLEDFPVPACLLNVKVPPDGWKELPTCK
ncbi:MAG: hypothetical protein K2P88_07885 [Chitinophagaceae bacterium]|uniref:hypothetical protein n=1 Tax=unclassified Paraflavitalea TaxID=2798305 RepID=UPI003D358A86|nr:hypothetical protein [Chitinophagaceae bacterium]